ncbi:MAG: amidohydrolase family protein [Burkholderiaceae bacterium]|nr:amidohydrolase family protein [Microbacteriaceae bacterium]
MTSLPRTVPLLTNATLPDGRRVDVEISGDEVRAVRAAGTSTPRTDAIDLTGFVLLTAPAEPHAHLDKARSWDAIDPPMGDLRLAIDSWVAYSATMTIDDIADRARAQALDMLGQGTTAIRCHVDLLRGPDPLRGVHALVRVRRELAGLIDIELVALCSVDIPDATIDQALDLGVDLVGGAPHLAPEPFVELRRLLAIAHRRGVGVDLHTDEGLTGVPTLPEFARIVRGWPTSMPATAGHCVRLGTLEPDALAEVISEVLASDIGIVSLPITNLYLQGWNDPVSTPRGLTALRTLLDRGVRVGAGADNVRDPFNPVGRGDALETASLLVTAGHLTLTEAYAAVSSGARSVMNLPMAGVAIGARAELLAVRGSGLADVVANAPADRFVIHAGRLVAQSTVHRSIALPTPVPSEPILEMR